VTKSKLKTQSKIRLYVETWKKDLKDCINMFG